MKLKISIPFSVYVCLAIVVTGIALSEPCIAYVLHDDGWDGPGKGSASLSYYWANYTPDLTQAQQRQEVRSAMDEWSKYADITWTETFTPDANQSVDILFTLGDYGNGTFDGPGGLLAYAYYPSPPNPEPIGGDMYFDEAETWTVGSWGGGDFDLYTLALHELGHSLGLDHSTDPNTVMYPFLSGIYTGLSADDIAGIQSIYASAPPPVPTGSGPTLAWKRQLGTSDVDHSFSVAIDGSGNAYISGYTEGDLDGPNEGLRDAFLAKYDSAGSPLWTRQLGTSSTDYGYSVAIDGSGNAYISGRTDGSLGGPNAGGRDAFLAKYDSSGSLLWTVQLGTSIWDESESVAIDGSGNAYICGSTQGDLGGPNAGNWDAFLAKYDSSGSLLWTKQLGTSSWDESWSVAIDGSGNVYISGYTEGDLGGPNEGLRDAFLAKYDSTGSHLWTRQLGTSSHDASWSVAIDGSGNAYISGSTQGSLDGPNAGDYDVFLAKYVVPEPSTPLLLAPALLGIAGMALRKKR